MTPEFDHPDGPEEAGADQSPRSSDIVEPLRIWRDELEAWLRTLTSAAVYTTLIVTFVFQVARVEGVSMAPTLADQDPLVVNKLAYLYSAPQRGDVVMLDDPEDPDKSFVKRGRGTGRSAPNC